MAIAIKYKLRNLLILILFSFNVKSQIIAPIVFTGTISPVSTHINAVVEDSINDRLYLQNSCICGVGPGNVYSALSYVNLISNQFSPTFVQYNPMWKHLVSTGLHYSNNSVFTSDGLSISDFTAPSFTNVWTYSPTTSQTVIASVVRNDSVFTLIDNGSTCMSLELRNRNTGSVIPYNSIDCTTSPNGTLYGKVFDMKILGNKLYLAGAFEAFDQFLNPVDTNITSINISTGSLSSLNFSVPDTIKDLEFYNNEIHIAGNFTSVKGQTRNHFATLSMSGVLKSGTPSFNDEVEKIEVYDNYLFAIGKYTTINSIVVGPSPVINAVNLTSNSIMNWNLPLSTIWGNDGTLLENTRNRLYTANRIQNYFAINAFCLPPVKTTSVISVATTSFCAPINNLTFSVSPFTYATSYSWSYTGLGASIFATNNIATVNFGAGATSGKLKLCASSACGGVTDTLFLNITVKPSPNISVSLVDDTLNCFKPKVPILGNSTTSGVSYAWSGPYGYTSIQKNDSTGYKKAGVYTLTVTTLASGCKSSAPLLVRIDTIKPNVTLPPGPYQTGCGTNSLVVLNGSSTSTPTTLWWNTAPSSTYTANPVSVPPGNYFLQVRNTYNGCKNTSTIITVTSSAAKPTVTLTSHTFNFSNIPVDTITCLQTSVTLSVSCTPTNCMIVWKDVATQTLSSNPVTIYGGGNQMPIVTRLDNSCVDSSMIVFVDQNKIKPNISLLTPNPNINCSNSTATLNAAFSPTSSTGVWTGPSSFSSANPAVTAVQGKYYFTVTRSDNGCSKKDSVNVGYSNTLVVDAGKDTTVCKSSLATLSAAVVGTVSSITYSWSTGAGGQSISVNPALTTTYIVTANGSAGCTGKDTVIVNIPTDMQDSIVTAKGCTGNNGSLTIFIKGGISPYKYSVNGSPFTTQITYTNLPFATYSVSIKDSIGCILNTTATINQNSSLNTPVFIASTQNFKGDTVVFIDLTIPKADSIKWVLPSIASIINLDMFNPVVVFSDTGSFSITEQAFYGICMTSTTKTIKIMPWDTAYASLINNNGIKILNLFPNPNNGQFTVQIEFYKKQNASVQIWDSQPQKHFQQNFINVDIISLPINVSQLQNGTYVLRVTSEYASKHFYFVISQ